MIRPETDEIFKVISHPMITNADSFNTVYSFLTADEKTKATIDDRFMGEWNVPELAKLPKNTLGYHYSQFMIANDLKVDFFPKVEGPTPHAYLQTRSRQTHDIHHVLTGFDTSNIGEAGIHGFQYAQTKSPAAVAVFMIFLLHTCLFDRAKLRESRRRNRRRLETRQTSKAFVWSALRRQLERRLS